MALYLALLSLSHSNAQNIDPTTGLTISPNVLNLGGGLPWSGTVTGQAGGQSGGGNTAAYNPSTGNIIFSYSQKTVSQMVAINTALANAGTGIQLGGYRYSWDINNDLNNSGGNRGTLTGNVSLIGSSGTTLESFNYNYSKTNSPGFTTFSGTQLFENQYSLSSVSSLSVSFTGKDQNWWAGYWGPRVHVNGLSLLYTAAPPPPVVDPCTTNPLSNPSCPGYGAAFVTKTTSASVVTVTPTITSFVVPETVTTSSPVTNVGGVQLSTTGTISAPDNIPQALKDVQAVAQQSQPTSTQTVSSSTPQSSKSGPNMSLIMSVIGQIQAADKATQSAAVQNANQVASSSSAKAQEQANQVVEALNTMSQASSQASMMQSTNNAKLSMPQVQQNTSVVQLQQPTAAPQLSFMAPIQPISLTTPQQSMGQVTFGSTNVTASVLPPQVPTLKYESQQKVDTSQPTTYVSTQVEQPKFENKQQDTDTPTVSMNITNSSSINDLFASKINIESLQSEQTSDTVNKNVSVNELAGSVDIASIATTPKGYEAYSFVLQDTAFYKTEAIYKDQKTVDNARLFRSLSNDRLHQEMIDQQYKGK